MQFRLSSLAAKKLGQRTGFRFQDLRRLKSTYVFSKAPFQHVELASPSQAEGWRQWHHLDAMDVPQVA